MSAAAAATVCALTVLLSCTFWQLVRCNQRLDAERHRNDHLNPHHWKLDRECEVWSRGRWKRVTVVAVSHKGAMAVRERGGGTWWVRRDEAGDASKVRWEDA